MKEQIELGTKVKYQVRKKSLEILYGKILDFKEDKILINQCYKDLSRVRPIPTWIDLKDIIEVLPTKLNKLLTLEELISIINQ